MPTATEKQILKGIQEIKQGAGCKQGAINSAHIINLQGEKKQHDKRIVQSEKDIASLTTKIDLIPEQVATSVKDIMPRSNRTMIPLKADFPFCKFNTEVPASWVGWGIALSVLVLGFWIHIAGMQEVKSKLYELHKSVDVNYSTNGLVVASKPYDEELDKQN